MLRPISSKKGSQEVTFQAASPSWKRSRRCDNSACVEVASERGEILVRDSKDPNGPVLRFSRQEWIAFADGLRAGDFAFED